MAFEDLEKSLHKQISNEAKEPKERLKTTPTNVLLNQKVHALLLDMILTGEAKNKHQAIIKLIGWGIESHVKELKEMRQIAAEMRKAKKTYAEIKAEREQKDLILLESMKK